jgi:hypothetical protein
MGNIFEKARRDLNRELAQERRARRAMREAVGPKPIVVTVTIRRDLWEQHRLYILKELGKLGNVSVPVAEMDGFAEKLADTLGAKLGGRLEPGAPNEARDGVET